MKIGVIFTALNVEEYLQQSLSPWVYARRSRLGGHEWSICAVSVPFYGFEIGSLDGTGDVLKKHHGRGEIDYLIADNALMTEVKARTAAMNLLIKGGSQILWQADGDEMPTEDQIIKILRFIESRQVDWYCLSLKNRVFTKNQYLVQPFTPPRIHRVYNPGGYIAAGFYQDNNIYYERPTTGERVFDIQISSAVVPKNVAWIDHMTWLNDARSRSKIIYQASRGWQCSFAWDESKGLVWSPGHEQETAQD